MSKSTLVDFYKVKEISNDIIFEVKIGHAQQGSSVLHVNAKKIGEKKNSFKVNLGNDIDLIGTELFMTTIVLDVSKETNNTSLTISLTGGTKKYSALMKQTVGEEGDIATYVVQIEFFK